MKWHLSQGGKVSRVDLGFLLEATYTNPTAGGFSKQKHLWIFGTCILWILSISGELGGHQGWGNLLSGLGEPAGRVRGNLPGRLHPTAL